jgi:hypothetical protein
LSVTGHRNIDDGGGDLSADQHRSGVDKSIVGGFVLPGVQPPQHKQEEHDGSDRNHQTATFAQRLAPRHFRLHRLAAGGLVVAVGHGILVALRILTPFGIGATLVVDALIHDRRLNV